MRKATKGTRICRTPGRTSSRRIALFLDLENLLHDPIATGGVDRALVELATTMTAMRARGTVVTAVACVDHHLWPAIVFEAARLGIRVHGHCGGPDAADHDLVGRMCSELPASVDTVVIGSGDHIFAPAARELASRGLHVEVLARSGSISYELYRATKDSHMLKR